MTQEEQNSVLAKVNEFGLLQFRAYDCYLIKSLKENKIVFGSRKEFNDPFDCKLPINLECSIVDLENLLLDISFEKGKVDLIYIRERAFDLSSDMNGFKRYIEGKIYSHRRFSCFTIASNKKQLLNTRFWANYANKHQGICMKFNGNLPSDYYNRGISVNFIPVEYCINDRIPRHNYIKDKSFRDKDSAQYFLGTKSMEWKDEEEIRLIYFSEEEIPENKPYIEHEFDPKYLEEIYLGCNLLEDDIKAIMQCLSDPKYNHVNVYRLERDEQRFILNPIPLKEGK